MRHLRADRKIKQIVHNKRVERRRKRRRWRAEDKKLGNDEKRFLDYDDISRPFFTSRFGRGGFGVQVRLPPTLSLSADRNQVVRVVDAIRNWSARKSLRYYDFSRLRYVGDAAALCLAAEIHRATALNYSGKIPARNKDMRWDREVERLLGEMGFFDLLEVRNPPNALPPANAKRFLRFRTGTSTLGLEVKALKDSLEELVGRGLDPDVHSPHQSNTKFYDALIEAMTNAAQHAYPDHDPTFGTLAYKRWWMSGSFDPSKSKFSAIFYDAGIGIPNALPAEGFLELARSFLGRVGLVENHSTLIKAAMELGRSSLGTSHRGKGLHQMRNLISLANPGLIAIHSQRGEYIWRVDEENPNGSETVTDHPSALPGTLIVWEVAL